MKYLSILFSDEVFSLLKVCFFYRLKVFVLSFAPSFYQNNPKRAYKILLNYPKSALLSDEHFIRLNFALENETIFGLLLIMFV